MSIRQPNISSTCTSPVLRLRRAEQPPRVWSPLDAFFYNLMTTNVAVFFGIPFIAGTAFYYPLESLIGAILIAGVACLLEALVYAFLVSSIPRNGGDYIFQSRLLSGAVGTTFAFSGVVIGGALWMGIAGWFASRVAVGPFLALLGSSTGLDWVSAAGDWIMSTPGLILLGLLAILWSALVNTWGMRVYARLQRRLVSIGFVALVILVAYFALTRLSVNVSLYRQVVYRAVEVGFRHQGRVSGWNATLDLLPVVAFGLIYPGWVSFQAAEVRRVTELKMQIFTIVGAKVASILFAILVLPLPIRHLGEELFGSSVYLALHDPTSFWVLAPRLFGLADAPWLSVITLSAVGVVVNTWFWTWVPNHTLAASRVMLAMSWDRLLPRWMSVLHARSGAPVHAVAVFSVISCLIVLLYSHLGVWRLALHGTLLSLATFSITCVAAALFPFRRREMYRDSTAAPCEIWRIPLITVAGIAFASFASFIGWRYAIADTLDADVGLTGTLVFVSTVYGLSLALHWFFRRYRRSHEGPDVELFYRDLASR